MKVGVLISGTGSNLQALIDDPAIDLACVVSSREGARGIDRARRRSRAKTWREGGPREAPNCLARANSRKNGRFQNPRSFFLTYVVV